MTSETASTFERARREERGLNARQREILDLIERGHTNREIADEFGMTLDGAKWNVSEILTKLGLASREEAAEYWRWRRGGPARQFVRRLGALMGMPAVRWAGVGVGAAAVGVVAVLALSPGDGSTRPGDGVPPFYLEAEVSLIDRSDSVGTALPETGELRKSTIRWWGRDRDHARFEVETTSPALDSGTRTIVVDGTNQWFYDDATNTYTKAPLGELPPEVRTRLFSFGIIAGPWFFEADGIDQALEQVRGFSEGAGYAAIVGHETILGRETTIIEYGPTASRGSSAAVTPNGQPPAPGATAAPAEVERYGTARIYLDVERMFILAYETENDAQNIRVRATKLDYPTRIADERVRFAPPKGATEAPADGSSNSGSGSSGLGGGIGGLTVPSGFFGPGYVPDGYTIRRSESGGPEAASFEVTFADTAGNSFTLQERRRAGGLPAALAKGDEARVHGMDAYFATDGGATTLAWYERGIVLLLSSDSLSREELLRIAEALISN